MRLPTDAKERKKYPLWSGLMQYFPDALIAVSHVSYRGNEQHNPGEPLHWAREKSSDHEDTLLRHLMDKGTVDVDGIPHSWKMAWRALAIVQLEIEETRSNDSESGVSRFSTTAKLRRASLPQAGHRIDELPIASHSAHK